MTLSEAAPPQHVLTVRARDLDDSRNGRLLYYLAGDGAEDFTIDQALGTVHRPVQAVFVCVGGGAGEEGSSTRM